MHSGDAGGERVARRAERDLASVEQDAPGAASEEPVTISISVDLPAPFSPISARIPPAFNSSDTLSSAHTPGKAFVAASTARFMSGLPAVDGAPAIQADGGEDEAPSANGPSRGRPWPTPCRSDEADEKTTNIVPSTEI